MVTIDLGVMSEEPSPPDSSRPRSWRTAGLAVCLVLAGGLLTASAPAERQTLPGVFFGPGDGEHIQLIGDRLYSLAPEASLVTAYTVANDEPVWRWRPDGGHTITLLAGAGDLLLVALEEDENTREFVALDAATAELRWRYPTARHPVVLGDVVLFASETFDDPITWDAVRLSDGARLWQRELPSGSYPVLSPDTPGRMLMAAPDGRIESWDLATGRVLASARTPDYAAVTVDGGTVVAAVPGTRNTGFLAFSPDGLEPLWERDHPGLLRVTGCGPAVICVGTETSDRSMVLDPVTGDLLWESESYSALTQAGPVLLSGGVTGDGAVIGPLVALDIRTGRVIKDFGGWRRIEYDQAPGAERTVIMSTDASGVTQIVAELDARAGSVRVLGVIHDSDAECHAAHGRLSCWLEDGGVGVFDLPVAR